MKKAIKSICVLGLCLCLCVLTGCSGISDYTANAPYNEDFKKDSPDSFTVAENEEYSLLWDRDKSRVLLFNKETGHYWSNVPNDLLEPRLDAEGYEISNNVQVEAPFIVRYYEAETQNIKNANAYTGSSRKKDLKVSKIKNGIKITYNFAKQKFTVPVSYTLNKDGISISINPSEITEAENRVYGVTLLPFFCSIKNEQNGYLFVPSGSGALIYARTQKETSSTYTMPVYGGDLQRYLDKRVKAQNNYGIKLPVFGAADTDGFGCMGIISSGAGCANINVNYGNSNIGYSAVYPEFQIRGYQNATALVTTSKWESQVYAQALGSTPVTVDYYPLLGENASYVGMANKYRDYLIERYSLSKTKQSDLLNISFLGGSNVKKSLLGIPYNSMYAATTLSRAQEIIEEIAKATGQNPTVNLVGYGDNGIDIGKIAGGYTVNSAFGGVKQLKKLSSYCAENEIPLYMDFNILGYSKGGKGINTLGDGAIATNYRATGQLSYNVGTKSAKKDGSYNLVKRSLIPEIVDKTIKTADKMQLSGIGIDNGANASYSDYREQKYFAGGLIESDVSSALEKITKAKKNLLTVAANDYAAAKSNIIYNAPLASDREGIFTCDIPFYQIVFKGYVPLTGSSVNLAANVQTLLLQSAETGIGLLYTICGDYDDTLRAVSNDVFGATLYEDLKAGLQQVVEEYKGLYEAVRDSEVVSHTILENSLRKTTFANGNSVYVNYTDTPLTCEDGEIGEFSYKLVERQVQG